MHFSERIRTLLDQSLQISRELASKAGERAQDLGEKSLDLVNKAGAKAQDLGERGVLLLEIRQLEGQAQKLVAQLGSGVYQILGEQGESSLSADSPGIRALLDEITSIRENIEKREANLALRK